MAQRRRTAARANQTRANLLTALISVLVGTWGAGCNSEVTPIRLGDSGVDAGFDAGFDSGFDSGSVSERCDVRAPGVTLTGTVRIRAGNDESSFAQIAAENDRWVVFLSRATNLVPDDTNGRPDVFLWDRARDVVERINLAGSREANGSSGKPSISSNGCFIVFNSRATNLIAPDENEDINDVFLLDRNDGTLEHISQATDGAWGNGESTFPSVSDDGRFVVFQSTATNLVSDDTNGRRDVFLRDRRLGTTTRISLSDEGGELSGGEAAFPRMTPDGRFVVFVSNAPGAVSGKATSNYDVFLWDRNTPGLEHISVPIPGRVPTSSFSSDSFGVPEITRDGRYVAFTAFSGDLVSSDTNGFRDVFVRDRLFAGTARVSVSSVGAEGNGNAEIETNGISANGRYVAFSSMADNLVSGDANGVLDVFIHDVLTGETVRLTTSAGGEPNGASQRPSLAADGRVVVYESAATNVVDGAPSASRDIYLHRLAGH